MIIGTTDLETDYFNNKKLKMLSAYIKVWKLHELVCNLNSQFYWILSISLVAFLQEGGYGSFVLNDADDNFFCLLLIKAYLWRLCL